MRKNVNSTKTRPKRKPKLIPVGDRWLTLEQLAAEQGARLVHDVDELAEQGKDVWRSDEEFDEFMAWLDKRRKGG